MKVLSEEHRRKLSIAHMGKKLTGEHKRKIGQSLVGHVVTSITRDKLRSSHLGVTLSDSHKKALGVAQQKSILEGRNTTTFKKGHSFTADIRKRMGARLEEHHRWKGGITKDMKAYRQILRSRNIEGIRAYFREWKKRHKEVVSVYTNNYRARFREASGSFTPQQWEERKKAFDNMCAVCGLLGKLTIDHIIPLSKGGSNDISNIQPLCGPCNYSKQDRLMNEFLEYRSKYKK